MHPGKRIDLILLNSDKPVAWTLGEQYAISNAGKIDAALLKNTITQTVAEWILIWSVEYALPNDDLLIALSNKPVDIWHAGLRLGLGALPDALNYIDPTWMYNKNASADIEHTSFRLSLSACLVKKDMLGKAIDIAKAYDSIKMQGVAVGYNILKNGGIIRYHPALIRQDILGSTKKMLSDEWKFICQFFPLKWQLWVLLNKPGLFKNINSWLKNRNILKVISRPSVHSSVNSPDGRPKYATVSVLAPTLDRYTYLNTELEQLAQQTILPYEVLITDQTSKDRRKAIDNTQFPGLTVKYFPQEETGQCIAWNKLLEEANGDYVLFLGDDADEIKPDFIEKLLATAEKFNCDIVASNVIEYKGLRRKLNEYYYLSDTFPIALAKRSLLLQTGFMDMFFNKNIRADHDLAMRCHLNGALMIFDSSAVIFHHRAPSGGLRTHKARVVTNYMSKNSITKFVNPTSSEIYLAKKYFSPLQAANSIKIKYLNQLFIKGSIFRKIARLAIFILRTPSLYRTYKRNEKAAIERLTVTKASTNDLRTVTG